MAIDPNALFLQIDSVYNANSLGLVARDVIGEGVTTATGLVVSQRSSSANMSVDVAAGICWVQGDEDAAQPTYRVRAGSVTNVAVTSAHASQPRIDLVVVRVADSQFSGSDDEATLEVIAGTPAASPAAPALPDNAVVLAQIAVAAQATEVLDANVTDLRQPFTVDRSRVGVVEFAYRAAASWGTLLCDGSTFSQARYPRLYAALGTATLPDLRGRAPIGSGQGAGLSARALGETPGVETVTLTAAQSGMPAHTPKINAEAFSSTRANPGGYMTVTSTGAPGVTDLPQVPAQNAASAHTNMQPSLALTPTIRV